MMKKALARGLALWLAGVATVLNAAPFTPASDSEVVERLPARLDSAARAQRAALLRAPNQLPLALATARAAIDRARRHGDPRELGVAQAALSPWWAQPDPPPAVRLMRATVRQSQHQFDAALADLAAAAYDRDDTTLAVRAQATLTRMAVLQVTGRLDEAATACNDLAGPRFAPLGAGVVVTARACAAELRSLRGQAPAASADLAALARQAPADPWLALVRAELAERLGDDAVAEANYRRAAASEGDLYAVAAYADWLLDRNRAADVLALLSRADTEADALLLRRALALKRLNDPRAVADTGVLKARFEAARLRGEAYHQREEARVALELEGDAARALELARINWAHQKEPADAVLLWRAARTAGRSSLAVDELQALRSAGWVDVRLNDMPAAASSTKAARTAQAGEGART